MKFFQKLKYQHLFYIQKGSKMAYESVTSCNQKPSIQQVLTIVLFILNVTLHSVFIVPGILQIPHDLSKSILIMILVLFYIFLLIILYDFIWISINDPVDRILVEPELMETYPIYQLSDCELCGKRRITSYHCYHCGRCTEEFDHHCKFLNNCIGGHNYENFIRLLLANILFHLLSVGQSIWIFVLALKGDIEVIWFWGNIVILGISGILMIAIGALFTFHCYISFVNMTTLEWIYDDNDKKEQNGKVQTERKLSQK